MAAALTRLPALMLAEASRPHRLGLADCAQFALAWVAMARGLKRRPPSYRGRRGMARALRRGGGWEQLARRWFAEIGLEAADEARPGDVALIAFDDRNRAFAVALPGGWFAFRAETGIVTRGDAVPLVVGRV